MNFKVTIETNDFDGISAIIDHMSRLEQSALAAKSELSAGITETAPPTNFTQAPQAVVPTAPSPQVQPYSPPNAATPAANPAPVQPPIQQSVQTAPTAEAPTYDLNALACAASPLMAQGKQQALQSLLAGFGVQALTQLPPERYGEFATALRGLGAQI